MQTLKQTASIWLPRPPEQNISLTLGCARTKSETAAWPKDAVSSLAHLQLGQTPKFELLDKHGTGVPSGISDILTMGGMHILLCIDVEDEDIIGRGKLKLYNELGHDEGSIICSR
jgi:hypothetical protein